ncbi:MAG: PAS domain S-box protein [Syntrophorhabdaceae bacterium]|nr:PAS domain S-box protein [Syntrophorhabdaceae bacterium]
MKDILRRLEHDLRERTKELNCLYAIADIVENLNRPLEEILQEIVNFLPQVWQHPDTTCSRIIRGTQEFRTDNFKETPYKQAADIVVNGKHAGVVEVSYLEKMEECDEGPFLKEERRLIDAVARRLGKTIERYEMEAALKRSEEKYRSIFENAVEGIFQTTPDGRYLSVNPSLAKMYGYDSPEEMIDSVTDIERQQYVDLEDRETLKNLYDTQGFVEGFETQLYRKDGDKVWISMNARAVRGANGEIIYYEGTTEDITRRKKAQEETTRLELQLRQSQKMEAIGTLAGGIAHDFNNILSGIMGFTEMVQDDMPPDSRAYHRLGLVLKGAHRGRDLIRQILTFSRQTEYEQKPVALSAIVEEGLKLLRPLLPATTEIRFRSLTDDDTILADSAQIHQVLMNLCTNGTQAMGKKGGVLEISVTGDHFKKGDPLPIPDMKPGHYLALKVRDTGPGMQPEVVERIFDPFFTTKAHGEGTGLGLSVVHGIVKSHGGFIRVESEPEKGSVFHIYLPKIEKREALTVKEELPVKGGKECILFVDDEDLNVELNSERLTRLGYEVVATTSSLEALEIFKNDPRRFHLVITDYTMPNLTGVELARKLLKVRDDIPIILCTGYNDSISPDRARRAGIREFLLKPQSTRGLDTAIRLILDAKDDGSAKKTIATIDME